LTADDGALADAVAQAFSDRGALARADAHHAQRPAQTEMALRIAQAIESRTALVAEAGTGIGKTYAYLVPVLLSGRRALISTATKSLQDQLFLRDLPRLRRSLAVPARIALLKGRASYLCRYRLAQAQAGAALPDRFAVRALARVAEWAPLTASGDLAELAGLDERSPVIPLVTSTRENCLGTECPEHSRCHVMQARREALAADIVVVNHHLFFADLALREGGVAELLPTVDVAVFDEAHQLVEAGVQFLGTQLATGAAQDAARDLLALGLQHARGLRPWAELQQGIDHASRELRLVCAGPIAHVTGLLKLGWDERARHGALEEPLGDLAAALRDAAQAAADVAETAPDWGRLHGRLLELAVLAERFVEPAESGAVRWIDLTPHQARLVESPLDIRDAIAEQRAGAPRAWVFTSATLGDDERLSWFTGPAGLADAATLKVPSPFDYARHARLWVPRTCPLPNEHAHPGAVGALAARLAGTLGGRTFVLTTTLRVLPLIAAALEREARAAGRDLQLLVQGSEPRRRLIERYGDGAGRVLLGSASFWEGIDMPGEALQCVLIDKLPFPPPNDPLVVARVRRIREAGGDAFSEFHVAEAAVSLKQGAGRLIRSENDRGLLVICDPRLAQQRYGRRLLAAIPPMTPLADEAQAIAWLDELASDRR
jgi:ATP-dependent DNA helicase DinG